MTYVDRTLTCVDCGVEFIHSAADQEYYQQKGFTSDPKRCASCRAYRRSTRDGGADVRDIGGPRGYERTDDRMPREYFVAICTSCGNQAQVPFKPRMDKPVYCSDCFRTDPPGLILADRRVREPDPASMPPVRRGHLRQWSDASRSESPRASHAWAAGCPRPSAAADPVEARGRRAPMPRVGPAADACAGSTVPNAQPPGTLSGPGGRHGSTGLPR